MMFKCDVCGRELNGITIVNGMSFCAKCYQETFVIPKSLSVKDLENCVEIGCQQCKQKDQRIAELEKENAELEQKLENAILPKFKIGQGVWGISDTGRLFNCAVIQKPLIKYKVDDPIFCGWYYDHELFATEQEAREKLGEMQRGKA